MFVLSTARFDNTKLQNAKMTRSGDCGKDIDDISCRFYPSVISQKFSNLASVNCQRVLQFITIPGGGGGGTPLYGLYRYVPRNRVWFLEVLDP